MVNRVISGSDINLVKITVELGHSRYAYGADSATWTHHPATRQSSRYEASTQARAFEMDPFPGDGDNGLFRPCKLGKFLLSHRVVLAPVTRCRAIDHVPHKAHVVYYSQRASKGGLIISEGVAVAPQAIGFPHAPGIYNLEQVHAWKSVVNAVHEKGGIIFCQLWHVGRASHQFYQPNGAAPSSSTNKSIPGNWKIRMPGGRLDDFTPPRALTMPEIKETVELYRIAARNARMAGFDGVEIHAAHGYLLDQFFKDGINDRTDEYGGSIPNRCRLGLEIISAVANEIGSDRTAVRISPLTDHLGASDSDPIKLGLYLSIKMNGMNLAYMHATEPRYTAKGIVETSNNCKFLREAYQGTFMSSGGYCRDSGRDAIRCGYADLVSYGRLFIANPDLPLRFALNAPLNRYDRSTFYTHDFVMGYTDYPFFTSSLPTSSMLQSRL